mmetsp:Transcript_63764/g.137195  ORF Transcript_63764/g.137195 Transcript_63764/m.137195 type:complete len:261 (+) Transcript_63764:77-859(+)
MDMFGWPWRCWVCQGGEIDEGGQEFKVPTQKASASRAAQGAASRGPEVLAAHAAARPPPKERGDALPRPSPREVERQRLRELMKDFVNRGMRGVTCEFVDEVTGVLRPGSYRIDERLQNIAFVGMDWQEEDAGAVINERAATSDLNVAFSSISEVVRFIDAEERFPRALRDTLSEEQKERLILVSYVLDQSSVVDVDEQGPFQEAFLLEASVAERQTFVTCVRILRRYMEEHNGGQQQIRTKPCAYDAESELHQAVSTTV